MVGFFIDLCEMFWDAYAFRRLVGLTSGLCACSARSFRPPLQQRRCESDLGEHGGILGIAWHFLSNTISSMVEPCLDDLSIQHPDVIA